MPRAAWSAKRKRQYDHIKTGLLQRGRPEDEAVDASKASLDDLSPSRRGGLRSHSGAKGRTHRQLYEEARAKGIAGRSAMNKAQLERALGSR
jgi:hypothetical protein